MGLEVDPYVTQLHKPKRGFWYKLFCVTVSILYFYLI